MFGKLIATKLGDNAMRSDLTRTKLSNVGIALFVVCMATGAVAAALTNQPAYALAGGFVGLYFLFAIRVADQWEKVAVLRFGRYIGLRGPGLFHMIPIVDTLSRFVDQRVSVASVSAESTLTRD